MSLVVCHRDGNGNYGTQQGDWTGPGLVPWHPTLRWYRTTLRGSMYELTEDSLGARYTLRFDDGRDYTYLNPPALHHWTLQHIRRYPRDGAFGLRPDIEYDGCYLDMVWMSPPGPNWIPLRRRAFDVGDYAFSVTEPSGMDESDRRPDWERARFTADWGRSRLVITPEQVLCDFLEGSRLEVRQMAAQTAIPPQVYASWDELERNYFQRWLDAERAYNNSQRVPPNYGGPVTNRQRGRRQSLEAQALQRASARQRLMDLARRTVATIPVEPMPEPTPEQTPLERAQRSLQNMIDRLRRLGITEGDAWLDEMPSREDDDLPLGTVATNFAIDEVNPETPVLDAIDELVDESLTSRRTMDSYTDPLAVEACELCEEQWHGAPGLGECDNYGRGLGELGCPGAYATEEGRDKWLRGKATAAEWRTAMDTSPGALYTIPEGPTVIISGGGSNDGGSGGGGSGMWRPLVRMWDANFNPVSSPIMINIQNWIDESSELPTDLGPDQAGYTWFVGRGSTAHIWTGTEWQVLAMTESVTSPPLPNAPWVTYTDQVSAISWAAGSPVFDGSRFRRDLGIDLPVQIPDGFVPTGFTNDTGVTIRDVTNPEGTQND